MELTFVRNKRLWKNKQNGKTEEVLDVFQKGSYKRHYRGMCHSSFKTLTGIKLKDGEKVVLRIGVA